MNQLTQILSLLKKNDSRSKKTLINMLSILFFKGGDAIIYLLLVPATLAILTKYEYGIWLTISTFLVWINTFDIGLGNGLRNKLPKAIIDEDEKKAKQYTSTTFFMLVIFGTSLLLVYGLFSRYINWYSILNVEKEMLPNLSSVINCSVLFFCLTFVFRFISSIFMALQLPAISSLLLFLSHVLSLLIIYILSLNNKGDLFSVAIVYSATPAIVYMAAYPLVFKTKFKHLSPSIRYFKLSLIKDLLSVGINFFILQVASAIIFASSNIIISKSLGPEEVTPYNITYRYFSIIMLLFNVIITPIWSAVTDAWLRNDDDWIIRTNKRIIRVIFLFGGILIFMLLISNFIYKIWINDSMNIDYSVSAFMACYIFILIWSMAYSNFLNGMNKLKLQLINIIIVASCYYPLSIYLTNKFQLLGMITSMCILNLSGAILNTIQYNKIITKKAKGIWNK